MIRTAEPALDPEGDTVATAEGRARTRARRQPRHALWGPWWQEPFLIRAVAALVASILLAVLVRQFIAAPYRIETASMQPALAKGDVALGWKAGQAGRGDVVSFTTPQSWLDARRGGGSAATSVGRVVGVAGDEVRCCDQQGRLVVNGISLAGASEPEPVRFRVVVAQDRLFVRSDDPASGVDSRCFLKSLGDQALVDRESVKARLSTVIWPASHWGAVPGRNVLQAIGASPTAPAEAVVEAAADANC